MISNQSDARREGTFHERYFLTCCNWIMKYRRIIWRLLSTIEVISSKVVVNGEDRLPFNDGIVIKFHKVPYSWRLYMPSFIWEPLIGKIVAFWSLESLLFLRNECTHKHVTVSWAFQGGIWVYRHSRTNLLWACVNVTQYHGMFICAI